MSGLLKSVDKAVVTTFSISLITGVYVGAFYIFNNLTMLNTEGVVFILLITTMPMLVVSVVFYSFFQLFGKADLAKKVVIFIRFATLLFFLRPSLLGVEFITEIFSFFPSNWQLFANIFLLLILSTLTTVLFRNHDYIFGVMISTMLIVAILMNVPRVINGLDQINSAKTGFSLEMNETPNIYFILADGLGSKAHLNEKGVDISSLERFLRASQFTTYSDTFSNYQPTTSAMSAMLNMDHHYYSLSGWQVDFSEVSKAARTVIGGQNNLTDILRQNGYEIQYNHGGTYLLLQGCSADLCFPKPDALAGARLILSHMFNTDLISQKDKIWSTVSNSELLENTEFLMESGADRPIFQYIHHYEPGHAPSHMVGKCDEVFETATYANRIALFEKYLVRQVIDIISKDPDAVIVIAGDHGPFISNSCNLYAYVDSESDYRDRAGAFISIRWPNSYDGKYDNRIKTGVNLFRYVLASLSDDNEAFLSSAVPDDVYTRAGQQVFKIIQEGRLLPAPVEYVRSIDGNEYNRMASEVPCDDPSRGSEINRGLCFYNSGEYRAALDLFQEASNMNPENAIAWNNVCATFNQLKEYDRAIRACNTAVSLEPDFELARNNLAFAISQKSKL